MQFSLFPQARKLVIQQKMLLLRRRKIWNFYMRIENYSQSGRASLLSRREQARRDVGPAVSAIIADVAARGDAALLEYEKKFDKADLERLEVSGAELDAALASIPPELRAAMETAAENIRAFHSRQVRQGFRMDCDEGVYLGQFITPIERVGLYIPGGTASYPSTVFMNAIPAKLAGCGLIVMCARYGEKIAVGADLKDGFVAVRGWTQTSALTCEAFFERLQALGVKTAICTDISRDGAMRGTNRALYKTLSERYSLDLVASGGVSALEDVRALRDMTA